MAQSVKDIEADGVKVPMVYEQSNYLPMVSMQIVFRNSGALYDTKAGTAHMSAKLLMEGTKKDGSVAFAEKLEQYAISLSASAGIETITIELSSLKSEFPRALGLLAELLKDPNYTEDAMKHIKTLQIGDLTQKQSDFDYVASLGLKETLFAGTPMGRPREGNIESITSLTLADVEAYLRSHMGRNNAMVVIGGDIDESEAAKAVESIVSLLPKVETQESPFIPATEKKVVQTIDKETQQAYIYFGAPFDFKYNDPNQHLAKVAAFILGGSGFGSRLMEEIRVKRGLAYSAYGRFLTNRTTSYLYGYLQTKLENEKAAKELVQQIVDEFVEKGITQKELDSTKEFLLGSEPLANETLSQRLGKAYTEFYYDRELGFTKKELAKIEKLTLEEINAFIKSHKEIRDISFAIVTKK